LNCKRVSVSETGMEREAPFPPRLYHFSPQNDHFFPKPQIQEKNLENNP
jgi:hypothetical protein